MSPVSSSALCRAAVGGALAAWTMSVAPSNGAAQAPAPVAAPVAAPSAVAPTGTRPPSWAVQDLGIQAFGARDGLQPSTAYYVGLTGSSTLWATHDDGASTWTGREWRPVAIPFAADQHRQVRQVLEASDGAIWLATRGGVMRRDQEGWRLWATPADGLADPAVFSMVETRAFGVPTIAVATLTGVSRFDGTRFQPVALPERFDASGIVLAETRGADGSPTLWVGSAGGGVAAYAQGAWQSGRGLAPPMRNVEALVPGAVGDPVELYAAGNEGLFARTSGVWRRVPMPLRGAYRVLPLRRLDGRLELWVGSQAGTLLRRHWWGRWDTVHVSSRERPAPITGLAAVPTATGEDAVYVSLRGARVVRVAIGRAGELVLPGPVQPGFVRAVHPVPRRDGGTDLWLATIGNGVIRHDGRAARAYGTGEGLPSPSAMDVIRWPDRAGGTIWAATSAGIAWFDGRRWHADTAGVGTRGIHTLAIGPGSIGMRTLLALTARGLFERVQDRWVPWPVPLPAPPSIALPDGPGDDAHLLVGTTRGAWRWTGAEWRPLDLPTPLDTMLVTAMAFVPGAAGDTTFWVAGGNDGLRWRRGDGAWHAVSPASHPGLVTRTVLDLEAGPDGTLLAAMPQSLVALAFADGDAVIGAASLSNADGLPASDLSDVHVSPTAGVAWVGTVRGVGMVPLARLRRTPMRTSPLDVEAVVASSGAAVTDGVRLAHDESTVAVELGLLTFHREEDARFRVTLNGADVADSTWSARTEYVFGALRPGAYTLRVWGRDWRGVATVPATLAFTVLPPWWQSNAAQFLYALLLTGTLVAAYRVRSASLRRRAADAEASERRVRASERQFRALFDRAEDAHFLFEDGRLSRWNPAARALLGAADDAEVPGLIEAAGGADIGRTVPNPATDLEAGNARVSRADGTEVTVAVQRTPIQLEDRTVRHVVMRDLTEVHRARAEASRLEAQLREAQKLESLGTLAGGVAHDFNNLLTIIRGNAEFARDLARLGERPVEEIDQILAASDRARDIVRQILTFSRRSQARREPVDVGDLVRHVQPMLRAMIPTSVSLDVRVADDDLVVDGDATQLQQALLNLCANAEYAMRATNGGRLSIAVTRQGAAAGGDAAPVVRLAVGDSGVGMTEAVVARLFEPFFTTKPVGEGTGLGMAVLHGIVESHGGRVAVTSEPGKGTTIELLFPAAAEPEDGGRGAAYTLLDPGESRAPLPQGHGETAVVVDDEPAVLAVVERTVRQLGYAVRAFDDSRRALAYLADVGNAADVLVSDQTMPGMTGDVLVESARDRRPGLPAVILTGHSARLTADRIAALRAPVLLKPVSPRALATTLRDVLVRSRGAGTP